MSFFSLFCFLNSALFDYNPSLDQYDSMYLQEKFVEKIDMNEVSLIFELGSLHGLEAILMANHYKCLVYTFECHPKSLEKIKQNLLKYPSRVKLVEQAVAPITGSTCFFSCIKYPFISSLYPFDYDAIEKNGLGKSQFFKEDWKQEKIDVECTRLDDFMEKHQIENIDLLCVDVAGAALPAIKSLGRYLERVKYIICELEYRTIYREENTFDEIRTFMDEQGFRCYFEDERYLWSDVFFIRKDLDREWLK